MKVSDCKGTGAQVGVAVGSMPKFSDSALRSQFWYLLLNEGKPVFCDVHILP